MHNTDPNRILNQVVDSFWETVPSFWNKVRSHIRQVAVEQFGITVEQFHILRFIRSGQGSVSEIATAKRISRAAISQAVDHLVNEGLIVRTQDTVDRRHIQLALTDSGNSLLNGIFDNTSQWLQQLFTNFSEAELLGMIQAMENLKKINQGKNI
jgi:DNA-binding MarR family transcriptional regulator